MERNSRLIFYTVLSGFFSSIIFGLLFHDLNIFNIHDTRFQIVLLGLFGSLMYAVMKFGKKKVLFYMVVLS